MASKNVQEGEGNERFFPRSQLEELYTKLNQKCLCNVELEVIINTLSSSNDFFASMTLAELIKNRDNILIYLCVITMLFDVSLEGRKNTICSHIAKVITIFRNTEMTKVINTLLVFLAIADIFVSYNTKKAIAALCLALGNSVCPYVLPKLIKNISHSENMLEVCHSLEVFEMIIKWNNTIEHTLENKIQLTDDISRCTSISVNSSDVQEIEDVKFCTITDIKSIWTTFISRLMKMISCCSRENSYAVVSFLSLWQCLVATKANSSVSDKREFHMGLEDLLKVINIDTPTIIWIRVLDLYNEVLCYGNSLATQDALEKDSCSLSHLILRNINDNSFLQGIPSSSLLNRNSSIVNNSSEVAEENLGSSQSLEKLLKDARFISSRCTDTTIQKSVLLSLKAIAVIVRDIKHQSSLENSSWSSGSCSKDIDLQVIEQNLREVLRKLDAFVKLKFNFSSESTLAEWLVKFFSDQDDWLVEAMLCGLDIYAGLRLLLSHSTDLQDIVNPHKTFSVFIESLHLDHGVLLDFLISNETCFLLFLLRYLKLLNKEWTTLTIGSSANSSTDKLMTVLIKLRLSIDKLVSKNLFPYNIKPILKLLEKCEKLYEE